MAKPKKVTSEPTSTETIGDTITENQNVSENQDASNDSTASPATVDTTGALDPAPAPAPAPVVKPTRVRRTFTAAEKAIQKAELALKQAKAATRSADAEVTATQKHLDKIKKSAGGVEEKAAKLKLAAVEAREKANIAILAADHAEALAEGVVNDDDPDEYAAELADRLVRSTERALKAKAREETALAFLLSVGGKEPVAPAEPEAPADIGTDSPDVGAEETATNETADVA